MQRRWSRRHMIQSPDITNWSNWLETAAGESWLTKCIAEMRAPRRTFSRAQCDSIIAMVLGRQAIPLPGTPVKCSERKLRPSPPDGLKTAAQAAARLGCSIKTLNGHVASGALKFVAIGHGKRRTRKMFADPDLNEFIANQTRKVTPCPSAATRARRSGSTDSKSEIVSFSEVQRRRRSAKPKR